jgi:hypothetical protein
MNACFRCGQTAFATLGITATIGRTALQVSGDAKPTAVCGVCLLELIAWFKSGEITAEELCSLNGVGFYLTASSSVLA